MAFGLVGIALVQWLYFVAIENLPVGVALLIEFTAPLFVALFVRFVYKEHVRRRIWIAVALCLTGLALVVELWSGVAFSTVGVTAAFGGALALSAYLLMAERERRHRDAASLSFYGFLFAALLWAVVQPLWKFPWGVLDDSVSLQGNLSEYTAPVWVLVTFIVVIGTMVTFSLLDGSLRHISATRASIVSTLEPVVATVVAWAWLGETLRRDAAHRRRRRHRRDPRRAVRALTRATLELCTGPSARIPEGGRIRGRGVLTYPSLCGSTPPARLAARLLRGRRARRRDGRARARALRRARLRPQADRPQHPRRARPRGARRDLRRGGDGGPGGRDGRLLGARRRAVGVRELREARAQRHRRRLSARDEGARPGAPLRGRGLHGGPHRPRGPRGGRRHDGRGARGDRARPDGRTRVEALDFPGDAKLAYVTQTTLSVDETGEIITALRRRFPEIRAPRKEDICYATSNRQWAVKEMLARDRPPARDRLEELVELEPARRDVARSAAPPRT